MTSHSADTFTLLQATLNQGNVSNTIRDGSSEDPFVPDASLGAVPSNQLQLISEYRAIGSGLEHM